MPYPKQQRHAGPLIYRLSFPNGKSYIGQTTGFFEVRMTKHKSASKNKESTGCRYLNAAIRKYGWSAVKKEILLCCDSDQLDLFESKMIGIYNSLYPSGYNLLSGGNSNKSHSTDTKEKMCLAAIRRSIIKGTADIKYGCFVKFRNNKEQVKYAIVDHPLCEIKLFDDEFEGLEFMEDLNHECRKQGIDWLEFNYFDDDNILNKRSTYFDVKHTLNSVIDIICKENLQGDKWKRISLSKKL
jgi:group I intron endonuclease